MKLTGILGSLAAGLLLVACGGGGGGGDGTTIQEGSAELSSLAVSAGTLTPAFSAGTLTYQAEVASSVASITVTARAADDDATILVNGSVPDDSGSVVIGPLAVGTTVVGVVVTAADGVTKKTYEAHVTRPVADSSHNADLASLELSAGTLHPAFSADVTAYAVKVANAVAQITFTPVVASPGATAEVRLLVPAIPAAPLAAGVPGNSGTAVESSLPSAPIPVPVGSSMIEVVVTAADATTKKTYLVTVNRGPGSTPTP